MLNFRPVLGAVLLSASLIAPTVSAPLHTEAVAQEAQQTKQSYIVVFQNKINEDLIKHFGGSVESRLESIHAVSTLLTEDSARRLSESPNIRFIEEDKKIESEEQYINPYLSTIGYPSVSNLTSNYYSGKGIRVGVLDTGIDKDHEDLKVTGGVSFVSSATSYDDDNGHGTHVAGIIAGQDNDFGVKGIAPNVQLYAIKVLDKSGSGHHSQIIDGIEWAVQNDLDIINLSLSSEEGSKSLKLAVDEAYKKGVHIVAASGNHLNNTFSEDQEVMYPAKYESVVAVGAIDQSNKHPKFSGSGPELEIVAPGVNIYSTFMNNTYESHTGTSMATPYVTAIYALYKEAYPNLSASALREKINKQAKDIGAVGRDVNYGYGIIQAPKLVQKPDVPKNVTYNIQPNGSVQLKWTSAATNFQGFNVYRDGVKIKNTKELQFSETIKPGFYKYEITAVNDADMESDKVIVNAKVHDFFPDFTSSVWYAKYVYDLNARHALSGYPDGNFYPLKPITRGEAVSMIGRALKIDGTPRNTTFPDVKSSYFASGYVATMTEQKLASGFPDGTFKPTQTISRGEVIALLDRAYQLKNNTKLPKTFSDITTKFYAYDAIQRFSAVSIANGYEDGTFKPNNSVTRSEMAVFLSRTIEESN
jgi:subtilisin